MRRFGIIFPFLEKGVTGRRIGRLAANHGFVKSLLKYGTFDEYVFAKPSYSNTYALERTHSSIGGRHRPIDQPTTSCKSARATKAAISANAAERFQLSKWYLDCVNDNGEALIGYWAELRWRRLAVRYASVMVYTGGQLYERSTLRAGQPPQIGGDLIEWSCDAMDAGGIWRASARPPISRVLYRRDDGVLEWRCLQPLAEASVRFGPRQLGGAGYTERVTLTLAPWDLPIEELRWGRAHFPGRSLVWIDWTGLEPIRLVLVDGMEVEEARVTDDGVSTPRIEMTLTGRCVLREGPLGGTSAGSIPGVRRALAKAGLLIDEHKWLSSATLKEGDVTLCGNAIHEVVRWR